MLNSTENRARLFLSFPLLKDDNHFVIDDYPNPDYNCIAWAAGKDNVWWWTLPEDKRPTKVDGVTYDWPFNVADNNRLETFIEIFSHLKYEVCDNGDYEDGYRKICFYGHSDEDVTHAARQYPVGIDRGRWTSKLGTSFTIIHGTPYSIESNDYGKVLQFMRSKWP